jgi:hypothetical protein
MKWSAQKCQTVNTENLPCFMISDKREVLIAFHENNTQTETGDKKKDKQAQFGQTTLHLFQRYSFCF